jgi:NADPH-dependent curcumin reductase CurA
MNLHHGSHRQIVLVARPDGLPVPSNFAIRRAPVPTPSEGEVLVRTLYLSIDAGLRGRLSDAFNYAASVPLGGVVRSLGIGEVLESRHEAYSPGQLLVTETGWQEYAAVVPGVTTRVIDTATAPAMAFLGVLGISGITAHIGMLDLARVGPGDTAVVSTAAGAVGSIAGQLAKAAGARTVGITGSAEKVQLCLDDYGYDACINYRDTSDLSSALAEVCPEGIDVYFDNVAADQLDAALASLAIGGRVVICGTMGIPPGVVPTGPRFERVLLARRASIQGFIWGDHQHRNEEIVASLTERYRAGGLRYREHVVHGLERAPEAFAELLTGQNLGKTIVSVGQPAGSSNRSGISR